MPRPRTRPRIEIYQDRRLGWHFRVVHANGEIAADTYTSERDARRGWFALKALARRDDVNVVTWKL